MAQSPTPDAYLGWSDAEIADDQALSAAARALSQADGLLNPSLDAIFAQLHQRPGGIATSAWKTSEKPYQINSGRLEPPRLGAETMDTNEIEDLFSGLGEVSIRRMFGGKGVYHRGLIIAVELRGEMLLKADGVSAPDFEAAGARRWTYEGKAGKSISMPYWSIPEEALDDPELMAHWARLAYDAALRSAASQG